MYDGASTTRLSPHDGEQFASPSPRRGGWPGAGPIDQTEHQLDDWEYLAEGISGALAARGIRCTDESRRAMESLPPDVYESLKYYERWAAGAEIILIEKGLLSREEIDAKVAELDKRWS